MLDRLIMAKLRKTILLYLFLIFFTGLASANVSFGFWPANIDPTTGYEPNWQTLSHVANLDWNVNGNGVLIGKNVDTDRHNQIIASKTKAHNVKFLIGGGSANQDDIDNLLAGHSQDFANNILSTMKKTGAEGITLDFEHPRTVNSITGTSNTPLFENMIKTVYKKVKSANANYTVILCTPPYIPDEMGYYKNENLSNYLDSVFIMGYDYHWNGPSGANSPFYNDSTRYGLQYAINEQAHVFGKSKLIYGVPLYAYDYITESEKPGSRTIEANQIFIRDIRPAEYPKIWDADSKTPYYVYRSGNYYHQVWYEDNQSLALKYQYIKEQGIQGIGFWALGYEGQNSSIWYTFIPQSETIIPPTESKTIPTASFSVSQTIANAPSTVVFSDNSYGDITYRKWSFGDGKGSTLKNPSHFYKNKGNYTISLLVKNDIGESKVTYYNYIKVG
jgi:spore germination protein YaaH